ncbi:MAG: hypothetical protein H7321_05485 [Bacteroidia bacterium]|nr:hypothetical protein [Bacteroidia bacterium]
MMLKKLSIFLILVVTANTIYGQKYPKTKVIPVKIKWAQSILGDFSFHNIWSYPESVGVRNDGSIGALDGGVWLPEMLDSNDHILKDSMESYYKIVDTTHIKHSMVCEAWCYEYAGTDYLIAKRINKDSIHCYSLCNIATHCSLNIEIINGLCYAFIKLNSLVSGGSAEYSCISGSMVIDEKLFKKGIIKSAFNFHFKHSEKK